MFKNFSHKASLVAKNELWKIWFLKKIVKISWNMGVVTTWWLWPNEKFGLRHATFRTIALKEHGRELLYLERCGPRNSHRFLGFQKFRCKKRCTFTAGVTFDRCIIAKFRLQHSKERTICYRHWLPPNRETDRNIASKTLSWRRKPHLKNLARGKICP